MNDNRLIKQVVHYRPKGRKEVANMKSEQAAVLILEVQKKRKKITDMSSPFPDVENFPPTTDSHGGTLTWTPNHTGTVTIIDGNFASIRMK